MYNAEAREIVRAVHDGATSMYTGAASAIVYVECGDGVNVIGRADAVGDGDAVEIAWADAAQKVQREGTR